MAAGTRALGTDREPKAWQRATHQAQQTRAVVAGQIADLLVAAAITGGRELIAQRIREYAEAERSGDPLLMRAAAMNVAVAFGAQVVRLDLKQDHPGAYRV